MDIQQSGKGLFFPGKNTEKQTVRHREPNRMRGNLGRYLSGLAITVVALFSCTTQAELILNGSTIYTDLGRDQFVAALYTETRHNSPQALQAMESEKRMEVRILNDYSKRRWVNLWMQSISINNNRETFSEAAEELIALMQAAKSAPRKGDLLEYLFSPEHGTSMRFNGTELISDLSGDVFGLLLRTWIGAIPPSTSFKEELLGNQRNTRSRDLLQTLTPSKERIALAASWAAPLKTPVKTPATRAAITRETKPQSKTLQEPTKIVSSSDTSQQREQAPVKKPETKSADQQTVIKSTAENKTDNTTDVDSSATENQQAVAGNTEDSDRPAKGSEGEEEIDFNISEALAQRDYTPLVVQKIYQNISYPSRAVTRNQEGTVRVALQIGRTGELQAVLTTQESKHSSLNKAALKAVQKAAPFPELPEAIVADSFELSIPITFRLQ